ncbi:MAG: glycosyltransferase family 2 protein [Alphaproteobacteria bacterium]|nr:glycosyltransferase family 2 protein [Alphaproteobacteria bacterium]
MRADGTPSLSALVVARNEAHQLHECLAGLAFADEVVVVLDRNTDDSPALARAAGAQVIEGAWEVEGARRNHGLEACRGEWVLEVDADERVGPALAAEIRQVIARSVHDWHEVPVDNYVGERLVRHGWGGSFGTSAVPRLTRRGVKRWGMQRIHPALAWNAPRGKGPRLSAPLVHHVDASISDMLRRLDRYAAAKATDLLAQGDIGTMRGNLRRLISRFFKCYVGRKGYREGGWGILIALCAGLFPLLAHLKARLEPERHRPQESPSPPPPAEGAR